MRKPLLLVALLAGSIITPAYAEFRTFDDVKGDFAERKERDQQQLENEIKIRVASEETTALLRETLAELKKQTALLEAIHSSQQQQDEWLRQQQNNR